MGRRISCPLIAAGVLLLGIATASQAAEKSKRSSLFGNVIESARKLAQPSRPPRPEESGELWDGFLTSVSKRAAGETENADLRRGFFTALVEGRFDVVSMLSAASAAKSDPLSELFVKSWPRLAPLFDQLAQTLPSDAAGRYRSLLDVGNALQGAQQLGGSVAGKLSATGLTPDRLRQLARLVLPPDAPDPLAYDMRLDPELRAVFGFGEPLAPPRENPLLSVLPRSPFDWVVPRVRAAEAPVPDFELLAKRLNGWVPTRKDIEEYAPLMHSLLQQTAERALVRKPLEPEFHALYDDLVLATAWQESCWRQFVRDKKGAVQPIQSGVGSVGLMQINQKVWRGFYDVLGLNRDVAYNGAAGAEILRHYLRDYAIKKGEHTATGNIDNLARSTYSIYNGGPGHIRRYRKPDTRADLKAIDESFWEKYQAVKAGDEMGVVRCYK